MTYFSSGKLLLTGEYFILKGATGFSLPTKHGQKLTVFDNPQSTLIWQAKNHEGNIWFEAVFSLSGEIKSSSHPAKAETLRNILFHAFKDQIFPQNRIETHLEFPNDWGLGSSSTLISLIAQWQEIDPMTLFFATLSGSGYDVACGHFKKPILYSLPQPKKPVISIIDWKPHNPENWLFVHQNKKQDSAKEIQKNNLSQVSKAEIDFISKTTQAFIHATDLDSQINLLGQHEELLSKTLEYPTLKSEKFSDFEGGIKSLGAWGGDFFLALHNDRNYMKTYFSKKGFETQLTFSEMIL